LLQFFGVGGLLLFLPITIKTQWNNYLPCDGQIAWVENAASLQSADILFSGSFTIEGWLYFNQAEAPVNVFSVRGEDNTLLARLGKENGQRFYFEVAEAENKIWRASGDGPVPVGEWVHVAGVFEKSAGATDHLSLYVNGRRIALLNEERALHSTGKNTRSIHVRLLGESDAPPFSGRLDEFRISSTARYTQPAIASLDNTFASAPSTVALWHFDEPVGSLIAADASGHGFDLVVARSKNRWPLKLDDFKVSGYGAASLLLSWKMKNEKELSGIEVQRRHADENFSRIGYVPSHGLEHRQFSYSFTDAPRDPGRYYYRLKMLHTEGQYRFSPEVGIRFAASR
jgi:hypothetical protein